MPDTDKSTYLCVDKMEMQDEILKSGLATVFDYRTEECLTKLILDSQQSPSTSFNLIKQNNIACWLSCADSAVLRTWRCILMWSFIIFCVHLLH